ncbi:hypothetical protein EG349_04345 [Chryseobacterium shandongense]|jgi:hypothetical protein|uniref:Quinol oxidase subunit 4 n=2 Tax=Chryseobacterium group TaxID=2782232 RepID=A0A3G6MXA5_9FLAO|nr:hypothetical protein EG350_11815 [Chryseobacterium shandongense]AZA86066.1 hypothetical protein EG349_04345 [Chryseobacterium shandongense]AZA94474.1 hypothetical protein EG353_02370 [Chryseobacterium shandongense]
MLKIIFTMNIKLLLSGILLLSILAACSDRYEEGNSYEEPSVSSHAFKRVGEQAQTTAKVSDSTKSKEIINAPQPIPTDASTEQGAAGTGETIDPTKPDRPK